MSFLLKFMSKNKLDKSWFGRLFDRTPLNITVKLLDASEVQLELPVTFSILIFFNFSWKN